jgi:hypothetical protein
MSPRFRRGDDGELVPHEAEQAIRERWSRCGHKGKALRAITAAAQAKISDADRGSKFDAD